MADQEDKEENGGALSAIILALIVVLIAVYVGAFGLQTLVWFETHHWTAENSWLLDVPQSLPASSDSGRLAPLPTATPQKKAAKPEMLKAYVYEFAPPWSSKSNTIPDGNHVDFRFDSGQDIVFFDPEAQVDTLRALKTTETAEYAKIRNVFAEPFFDSNYDLYNSVYSASPAQTSPFMNSTEAMRKNVLLLWKLGFGFDLPSGIHSIAFGNNRGFEFGDPANGQPVALRIFTADDKQFRFIFTVEAGSSGTFTQGDINSAVQTFQQIPLLER
jgi:hypothetical protein